MSLRPTEGGSDREAQPQLNELDERAALVLAQCALDGLTDVAAGRFLADDELDQVLAVPMLRKKE